MLVAVTWTQLLVHAAAVAAGNGDNDRSLWTPVMDAYHTGYLCQFW